MRYDCRIHGSEGQGSMIYRRIALIGMGLVASSIALAAKRHGLADRIDGHAKSAATSELAMERGLVDKMHATPEEAVDGADLVVLCTPVSAFGSIVERIAPFLGKGATLSDVGSVKSHVIKTVAPLVPEDVHFIPAHPIAGTEHSGPQSGFAELFEDRWCILTPGADADQEAVDRLAGFWNAMGAQVDFMDADHHDLVLAVTSHAPHLIAYTMVGVADHLRRVTSSEVIKYSAAGFRDFTRIAASDPTMWRDVFLGNKQATLEILGRFTEELFALQRAIRTDQGDVLHKYFRETREIRRGIIEAGQDTALSDFGRRKDSENQP